MPIRVSTFDHNLIAAEPEGPAAVLDLADGEALFELLCAEIRGMTTVEQLEVLNAFQAGGWQVLPSHLQRRFERAAGLFLDGGGI